MRSRIIPKRRRRTGIARFARRHDQGWVPFLQFAGNLTAGITSMSVLVDGTDWSSLTMGEDCTIMTVVGELSVNSDFLTGNSTSIIWAIMVADINLVVSDLDLAAIDTWERSMLYTGCFHASHPGTEQNWDPGRTWQINLNTKRRMSNKERLILLMESSITNGGFGCILRTLVRRN